MAATKKTYFPAFSEDQGIFISWRLLTIVLGAAVAIGLIGLLAYRLRVSDSERGARLLVEAFSKRRLIEPRLSGGFRGGEFNLAQNRGAVINIDDVDRATELIENAFDESDPHSRLAYGRLLLSKGGKGADALKHLRLTVAELPDSSEAHNDLGVCLIEQGKLEDALDEFNLALKSKANMTEALFNRALCYERLLLRDAASQDYARALEIESDSTWVNEINSRLTETAAKIMPREQQTSIIVRFEAALDRGDTGEANTIASGYLEALLRYTSNTSNNCALAYLKAAISGDQIEAEKILSKIRLIGKLLIDRNGDTSIADLASYFDNLPSEERQAEANLITEYLDAEKRLNTKRASEAQSIYLKLSSQFANRGNYLFQYYSEFGYAIYDYSTGLSANSVKKLEKSLATVEKHNWPYRRVLLFNQLAAVYSKLGQDSLTLKYCDMVIKGGHNMPLAVAKAYQYMANTYSNLGDIENTLLCLRRSTSLFISSLPTYSELSSNFESLATAYSLLGKHSLALLFAKDAIGFSENKNINGRLAQVTSFIALEHARLNQFTEATDELNRAFTYLDELEQKHRAYPESVVQLRGGNIAKLQNNAEQALQYYAKAELLTKQSKGEAIPMLKILRGRAEAYIQKKEYGKANENLEQASQLIQDYRANITDRKNRSDFLQASQSVFDEMIVLNIRAFANWPKAFNLSEQSRARTLLDDLSSEQRVSVGNPPASHPVNPLTLSEVRAALPDDLRVINYSVTNQKTFIFLITRTGTEWAESPATTEKLDQLVQQYMSDLKSMAPLEEVSESGRELYRNLIAPIEGRLGDGKQLCIVPDKAIHLLPFAALVDESNKYLIESYRISYAPSASVLVQCLEEARRKGTSGTEKILAVGNPLFNKDKFPTLQDIPDAEREASHAASFYDPKDRVILTRKQATKEQVLAALKDCDVAHFSLHCLVEAKSPWLAALVLAEPEPNAAVKSSSDNSLLSLNEVYDVRSQKMSLPRMRLVILSACESGLGQYYRGEGMVSLVRPFLALRVPTIVASLWSVDSQATAILMIDFHKERKANNLAAGDALRAAQIKMARSASYRHPYYWAPFIAVGSNN